MVKDFRSWLGNKGNKHTEAIFERCALTLVERKRVRDLQRKTSKVGSMKKDETVNENAKKELELDAIFLETFVLATELNLFGEGPPRHMDGKRSSSKRGEGEQRSRRYSRLYEENEFSSFSLQHNDGKFNVELLKLFGIGEERLKEYFRIYLKQGDLNCAYRGKDADEYVSLKRIPTFAKEISDELTMKRERCISLQYAPLKTYTNTELIEEINFINSFFANHGMNDERRVASRNIKEENVQKLMYMRERLRLLSNSKWKEYRDEQLRKVTNGDEGLSPVAEIKDVLEEQLKQPLFYFGDYGANFPAASQLFNFERKKYINDNSEEEDPQPNFEPHGTIDMGSDDEEEFVPVQRLNGRRKTNFNGLLSAFARPKNS